METFIIDAVQRKLEEKGSSLSFDIDTNLIAQGVLDSLEFIGLLMELETEFNLDLDFSELDPSEFTTISGLVRILG